MNQKKKSAKKGAMKKQNVKDLVQKDYYATEPKAVELLLEMEEFNESVWECACGGGHISKVLKEHGYQVKSTDSTNRGFEDTEIKDFLTVSKEDLQDEPQRDIITNPPAHLAKEFVEHSLQISKDGTKVAMFLKLQFLEGRARRELWDRYPPKTVYVSSGRLLCAKNGDFENADTSSVAYAWYVWEKGYTGEPVIKWFN